jgi:hypothetical protein
MALPIRRVTPQPPPRRAVSDLNGGVGALSAARSQWIQSARYNSGGFKPAVIRAVQKRVPTRGASDVNSGVAAISATRGGTQWIQAARYNSGGFVPKRAQAVQKPTPIRGVSDLNSGVGSVSVVRGGTQWIQSARYNSGGLAPVTIQRAVQKPRPLRPASHVAVAAPFNSGGFVPTRVQSLRQKPPVRAFSRLVVPPPSTVVVQPLVGIVTKGIVRKNLVRSATRSVIAPLYNSGGLVPTRLQSARQKPPVRAASRFSAPPAAQSRIITGTVRKNLVRPASRVVVVAPLYNSSGIKPIETQGVRRRNLVRPLSHLVVSLIPPVVVQPAAPSPIYRAVYRPRPTLRPRPHWIVSTFTVQPIIPQTPSRLQAARQKPPVRPNSHIIVGVTFNSGGFKPVKVVKGVPRIRIPRGPSRLVVPYRVPPTLVSRTATDTFNFSDSASAIAWQNPASLPATQLVFQLTGVRHLISKTARRNLKFIFTRPRDITPHH